MFFSRTTVSLRRTPSVEAMRIKSVTLNDPSCRAIKNSTHWSVGGTSTACGSVNLFTGSSPMFRNSLVLTFDSNSDFAGRRLEVPFSCRLRPGLPGTVST